MKKFLVTLMIIFSASCAIGVYYFNPFRNTAVSKPEIIEAFLDTTFLTLDQGQHYFIKEYEKETGIILKVIQPIHEQYYSKLKLAIATDSCPDVVELSDTNYLNYARSGFLAPLDTYVQQSPTLKEVNQVLMDTVKVNGKLYGIPREIPNGPITYVRKDWLMKLNMRAPRTWNGYYQVLKAFTQRDPDCDRRNDTYGATAPGVSDDSPIYLADQYYRDYYQDASPNFVIKNGKWVDGFMQKEFKGALNRLRLVYQEKLIDPEIFTNKTSTCRDKFTAGKAGIFSYWSGLWNVRLDNALKHIVGRNAEMIAIPPLKGSHYLARVPSVNAITVKSKNPQGVFKYFIEYMHDGKKGQMLFTHGVENVHWGIRNGVKIKLPLLGDTQNTFEKTYNASELQIVPWKDPITPDKRVVVSNKLFFRNCIYSSMQSFPESRDKIEKQLNAAKNDVLVKVVTGVETADKALAEYAQKYQALDVDRVLQDMNRN